ncbi:MAG: NAD(P)-dependent oxidoreductase [Bacteriovoracaceae bacterium]|nr:NAD(P)-dependent oxidoreductase [Bacteriovoracaceae bacterium]
MAYIFDDDLEHIFLFTQEALKKLKGKKLFITGGTGFFGKWLLEGLLYANKKMDLHLSISVLSRYPEKFIEEFPHLKDIEFIKGDIRSFKYDGKFFDYIIHGATEASVSLNQEQPELMYDTIFQGTSNLLKYASACGVKKILNISSGAVYGKQPSNILMISEDQIGIPTDSAYEKGKKAAEFLLNSYSQQNKIEISSARCFAFIGPHLPLNSSFAVGNFIGNVLEGKDILVKGDGSALRSYLYASDLVIFLLNILVFGKDGAVYNVGSESAISIKDLALEVANFSQGLKVIISQNLDQKNPDKIVERYVPSIKKIKSELNVDQKISLKTAIKKTINWHKGLNS